MIKVCRIFLLTSVLGLTCCAYHYVADVSLNDALTQYGRINSHDLPLGTVLVWNRTRGEIDRFPSIPRSSLSLERTPLTGTEELISIRGKYRYYRLGKDARGATGFYFRRVVDAGIDNDFAAALRRNSIE